MSLAVASETMFWTLRRTREPTAINWRPTLWTAALAMTRFVKPKLAIPSHYGSFPIIARDAAAFVEGLQGSGVEALVPEKGKAVTV